jgi:simple sugar transport system ATP-binding protein
MVPQHFDLITELSVAENVVLGSQPSHPVRLERRSLGAEVGEVAKRFGIGVDVDAPVESLSADAQQQVEILKLLYRGAGTLILDEPTAVLGPAQVDRLLDTLRGLADAGNAIVVITHKLAEVMAAADRVTVLRAGRVVRTSIRGEFTEHDLVEAMIGRQLNEPTRVEHEPATGPALLAIDDLVVHGDRQLRAVDGVSLSVEPGEIVGIAGVEGNGQHELAEALAGLRRPAEGRVVLGASDVTGSSPRRLHGLGVSVVSEDRLRYDIVADFTLAENLALAGVAAGEHVHAGLLRRRRMRQNARRLLAEFDVRPPNPDARAGTLSGGNQQKLVLARELARQPRLLVAVQPTRGLDVDATEFVHRKLLALRDSGSSIVLVSLDLDELMLLADRLVVLYRGRVALETRPDPARLGDVARAKSGVQQLEGAA